MTLGRNKNERLFLILLGCAFAVGLAIAIALCMLWKYDTSVINAQTLPFAIAICPPFLLISVLQATSDNILAVVMTIGTIIFSNGFLYAGLSSLAYFIATVALARWHRS